MTTPRRIAVIGGGLAGLTAAFRLEHAGARVTVLGEGEPEAVWPFVPDPAPHLYGLLCELGVNGVRRRRVESLPLAGGRARRSTRAPRGIRTRRLRSLLEWFGPSLDPACPERGNRLDDRSVADFARLYLGRRMYDEVYAPIIEAGFGLDPANTSRQLLMLLMNPLGDVGVGRASGLAGVTEALGKQLADVREDARVVSVRPGLVQLADGEEIEVDATLIAAPATTVPGLVEGLCPAEDVFFASCGYNPRVTVAVSFSGATFPTTWVSQAKAGGLAALGCEDERVVLIARPAWANARRGGDDNSIADALLNAAESVRPGFRASMREPRVHRGEVARFDVGHFRGVERLRAETRDRFLERRFLVCGDYLVGPHAEGAVVAGERGAGELLELLDRQ